MYKDNLRRFFWRIEILSKASEYSLTKDDIRDKLTRLIDESIDPIRKILTHPKYLDSVQRDKFIDRPWVLLFKQLTEYGALTYKETQPIFTLFAKYYLSSRDPDSLEAYISKVERVFGLSKEDIAKVLGR